MNTRTVRKSALDSILDSSKCSHRQKRLILESVNQNGHLPAFVPAPAPPPPPPKKEVLFDAIIHTSGCRRSKETIDAISSTLPPARAPARTGVCLDRERARYAGALEQESQRGLVEAASVAPTAALQVAQARAYAEAAVKSDPLEYLVCEIESREQFVQEMRGLGGDVSRVENELEIMRAQLASMLKSI